MFFCAPCALTGLSAVSPLTLCQHAVEHGHYAGLSLGIDHTVDSPWGYKSQKGKSLGKKHIMTNHLAGGPPAKLSSG